MSLIEALVNGYAEHLSTVQTTLTAEKAGDRAMLEAYAEWYKRFSTGKLGSGSSPLLALAMASRENRRFMEPGRAGCPQYFDRVKQSTCGSKRTLCVKRLS